MIKGWYAKHKDTGKWHKIEDIKDTGISAEKEGGGNNYHLEGVGPVHQSKIADMAEKPKMEKTDKLKGGIADNSKPSDFDSKQLAVGIRVEMEHTKNKSLAREIAMDHLKEDPKYYTKLKEVEKYDRVDTEADGKKELDYGVEELDKLKDRWNKLKKATVDSNEAIMEIAGQEYNPDEDEDEQKSDINEDDGGDGVRGGAGGVDGSDVPAEENQPESSQGVLPVDESNDDGDVQEEAGDQQSVMEALSEAGYDDAEIAHIVHGHNLPEATIDDTKMENEQAKAQQDLQHKSRMNDLAHETASQEQGINELDKDHKKRMLDLEYDAAKQEKAMELDFKKKEFEMKLNHTKTKNTKAIEAKSVDASKSRTMDAATTSKNEKAGK